MTSKIKVNTVTVESGCTVTLGESGKNVVVANNDIRSNTYKAADGGVIASQSGTTITLGASGDTIALASGASQTGFGRTGTVDWQTGSIKTATFTAANGEGYFCNTTGGAFTVNLPAGSAGAIVSVQDYNNTFDSNSLTVAPNGSEKINGGSAGGTLDLSDEGQGVTLVYIDSTVGWRSVQENEFSSSGSVSMSATVSGCGNTQVVAPDCANYKLAIFTGPGNFDVTRVAPSAPENRVDYLVVAGGAGGSTDRGGGGGAGGLRASASTYTVPGPAPGSPIVASPAAAITATVQTYPIVVGAGGTAGPGGGAPGIGGTGGVSTFSTITSAGGGAGGGGQSGSANGSSGGSGGGARDSASKSGGTGNTPPVSPAQGTNGGSSPSANNYAGGGGGGVDAGDPGSPGDGGDGGGFPTAIAGSKGVPCGGFQYFAGGGGGGTNAGSSSGGKGGGGGGGNEEPDGGGEAGTINTGGGSGGGNNGTTATRTGGSGIVILRYKFQ